MAEHSADFLAFRERFPAAIDAALIAAGDEYKSAVQAKLSGGETTGAFTTGEGARAVERSDPYSLDSDRAVSVGTDDEKQRYWELGAFNAFTRRFERVEHWRNALVQSLPQIGEAFRRTFVATLGGRS
jgi:hypothetical protein